MVRRLAESRDVLERELGDRHILRIGLVAAVLSSDDNAKTRVSTQAGHDAVELSVKTHFCRSPASVNFSQSHRSSLVMSN